MVLIVMADNNCETLTILFADVAGSVNLYETYGDIEARCKVVQCLGVMSAVITAHMGRVIETIGDEIMCVFSTADDALKAACAIQTCVLHELDQPLGIRIGFHHGLTCIEHNNRFFGDTVNMASRMAHYSKAGQIILSQQAVDALTKETVEHTRFLEQVYIKGKATPVNLYEVEWDERDSTQVLTQPKFKQINRRKTITCLQLHFAGSEYFADKSAAEFTLGRGKTCDLVVSSKTASRLHISLRCQHNKIVIKDHSMNGSYIKTDDGKRAGDGNDLFIRNEECTLEGGGIISLGAPISDDSEFLISFQCMFAHSMVPATLTF